MDWDRSRPLEIRVRFALALGSTPKSPPPCLALLFEGHGWVLQSCQSALFLFAQFLRPGLAILAQKPCRTVDLSDDSPRERHSLLSKASLPPALLEKQPR